MLGSTDLADDVAQETFIALYKTEASFESKEHVRNWLIRTAANKCRNILRSRKRHPASPLQDSQREVDRKRAIEHERASGEKSLAYAL